MVQVITKGREPWFLAQDLGRLLELTNIRKNLRQIPKEEKSVCYMTVSKGEFKEQRQRVSVVNEAGLYRLIMMSRTEAAEKFKTWVFREVLPAIRKTGKYECKKGSMFFKEKSANSTKAAINTRFRALEWIKEGEKTSQAVS
jgi:prophage antirepressor-like protein